LSAIDRFRIGYGSIGFDSANTDISISTSGADNLGKELGNEWRSEDTTYSPPGPVTSFIIQYTDGRDFEIGMVALSGIETTGPGSITSVETIVYSDTGFATAIYTDSDTVVDVTRGVFAHWIPTGFNMTGKLVRVNVVSSGYLTFRVSNFFVGKQWLSPHQFSRGSRLTVMESPSLVRTIDGSEYPEMLQEPRRRFNLRVEQYQDADVASFEAIEREVYGRPVMFSGYPLSTTGSRRFRYEFLARMSSSTVYEHRTEISQDYDLYELSASLVEV